MGFKRLIRGASIASTLCCATLWPAGTPLAVSFSEFVDPNPAPGNQFGTHVVPLSTGNVVITSPLDDAGGTDAGAVYLFNGSTGALISTLRGSTANDNVGSRGVLALSNGNYVIRSPNWDNGVVVNAGAVTWGSGTAGVNGVVSGANSLVGSTGGDAVGYGNVTALTNGNYVVRSQFWDNGAIVDAGAVTWGSGATGVSGVVSVANSLVGPADYDNLGGALALSNGNYVVVCMACDNGAVVNAGAVTWGDGTTGVTGVVSAANSLVGSTAGDFVGIGAPGLSNGNYVVRSPFWDNGAIADAGAVTWCNGTTGVTGVVSAANSLIGSTANDQVGTNILPLLLNGNYVVTSPNWDNGAVFNAGAATWCNGTTGLTGVVSTANSLVGSQYNDQVGGGGATQLFNGNYVVLSAAWDNGAVADAGAATWGNGSTGLTGVVSAANSLVGSTPGDVVGRNVVTRLTNGNYVVGSASWQNGGVFDAGAATWGDGTSGVTGVVSPANSLVGSTALDHVGTFNITALSNGNYVVGSQGWDSGSIVNAGAATWGDGTTGVSGVISAANSLVGSATDDQVGTTVTALTNGNYVVCSPWWSNGSTLGVGAATWGDGTTGVSGVVSAANSLIGSTANDGVGNTGVTALSNGSYVVASRLWDDGAVVDAGAVTWCNGTTGVSGVVSAASSLVGTTPNTNLQAIVVDDVNDTFIARFLAEGGGRVRVGSQTGGTTAVGGEIPLAFALDVRPNPSSGKGLRVGFALPTGAHARLQLLDVSGRRVLEREVGSLGAGRHTVNLAEGRRVVPGIYWVRLVQGANRRAARVAVIE